MHKLLKLYIFLFSGFIGFQASANTDILISPKIKSSQKNIINKDLDILNNYSFRENKDLKTKRVLGLKDFNTITATRWLNNRVKYIVDSDKINIEQTNVDYPTPLTQPFSDIATETDSILPSFVTMSNLGAATYLLGKANHSLYNIKFSRGILKKPLVLRIDSPRVGILQLGEGLFSPGLAINRIDPNAIANTILRLSFIFHEARHSDGNGESLGFTHSVCPHGHDYENEIACDESLNGAYSVGAVIAKEMLMSCGEDCTERDKEMLKIFILDNYGRIQTKTHQGLSPKYWDTTPEKL